MEFFILELLLLSSAGSVLLMGLGMLDGAVEFSVPNPNRFLMHKRTADRPEGPGNAAQEMQQFDEAA